MKQTKALIWDFDGTLAYQEGKWSGAMLTAIQQQNPMSKLTLQEIRPLMQSGFPWDTPAKKHPELSDPTAWWTFLEAYLIRVGRQLGLDHNTAQMIARRVHEVQADGHSYHLFPDTIETLAQLKQEGWRQIILSNHVPELPKIVQSLGLTEWFDTVLGSAQTAVEKPHPDAFSLAKEALGHPEQMVMIGDNPHADGEGALAAGLPVILVHQKSHKPISDSRILCVSQLNEIPAALKSVVKPDPVV